MNHKGKILLEQFISGNKSIDTSEPTVISSILKTIEIASKNISETINRAGLEDILGAAGKENVQGEQVQKLDLFANDQFIDAFSSCPHVAAILSEENDEIIKLNESGEYLFATDPLDGSSNIDVNISVGTIFSVFKRNRKGEVNEEEFHRFGYEQILAGYVLYGTSTVLIYTSGQGVHSFTLNPTTGLFVLTNESIKTPESGNIYLINEGL